MRKNIGNIVFCVVFVIMLLTPLCMMEFRENQMSEIDNEYLPEAPEKLSLNVFSELELYMNKRIGLRKESLDLYQKLNSEFFGLMEHPLYMYGKDGYVFFKAEDYIKDYQHLNLDYDYARKFADEIDGFGKQAEAAGKKFYYLLLPDKKTVYSEHFPGGVNKKGDISRTDVILEEISKKDFNYMFAKDLLLEAKKQEAVYNVEYDAGHWNENGAFLTIRQFLKFMQKDFPDLKIPDEKDYNKSTKVETSLNVSHFEIHEEVPCYSLKNNYCEKSELYKNDPFVKENKTFLHYVNNRNVEAPKILIFHDSYFIDKEKFFTPSFSEITFIHRSVLTESKKNYNYLLELTDPDIIVYENCERVFPIEFNE